MPTWFLRPQNTCCAVVLGNDPKYIGYDPQLNEEQGDRFCGKPVDHKMLVKAFNEDIKMNLCTNHFTWLVTYTLKYPLRDYPS